MATEPTLIRRYTPPTCSLEIMAQPSPLSRWMGKPALKDLRFKLSFDDPRVNDEEWLSLRGDRQQLEELTQVVGDYVQFLLVQSPIGRGTIAANTVEQNIAAQTAIAPTTTGISLQPVGLLSHELRLGRLAVAGKPDTLRLSSTQLADLSTALDECEAEVTTLPELDRPKVAWLPSSASWGTPWGTPWGAPNWAGLAAGVLVVVGLGASLLNGLSNRNAAPTTTAQASSSDQRLSPPLAGTSPSPSPLVTIPPLAKLPTTAPFPGSAPGTVNPGTSPKVAIANPGASSGAATEGPKTIPNSSGQNSSGTIEIKPPPKPGLVLGNDAAKTTASESANNAQIASATADDIGSNVEFKAAAEPATEGAERARVLGSTPLPPAPVPQPAAIAARSAAPVGNSQAGEVQAFFSNRWKPGANQKELQYTIELNADGSFKQGSPIGTPAEAAGTAILPEPGAQIAPPSANGQSTSFTVLLESEGGVQAIQQ